MAVSFEEWDPDRCYCVTVRDAGRVGFLLGPYDTHEEALANVGRGKGLALAANCWAWFYGFGTSSLPKAVAPRTVFGR